MEPVSGQEFLRWAVGLGIDFDPRYPDAHSLGFVPPRDHSRFWVFPGDPATWPNFSASLLEGLDEWTTGFLFPRLGSWPHTAQSLSYDEKVRDVVLRGAGIPDGWAGAIRFGREEKPALLAVLFPYLAFGWCVKDDLFFVPDHGRQVVQTDHHDVIHAECLSEERMEALVAHMAQAGYEVSTEMPDSFGVEPRKPAIRRWW